MFIKCKLNAAESQAVNVNILLFPNLQKNKTKGLIMKALNILTIILLVVGGLNWGLVGFLNFDLVAAIFGEMKPISRIVYSLVGLSAVFQAVVWKAHQSHTSVQAAR
jgi:uncharacterized protein